MRARNGYFRDPWAGFYILRISWLRCYFFPELWSEHSPFNVNNILNYSWFVIILVNHDPNNSYIVLTFFQSILTYQFIHNHLFIRITRYITIKYIHGIIMCKYTFSAYKQAIYRVTCAYIFKDNFDLIIGKERKRFICTFVSRAILDMIHIS